MIVSAQTMFGSAADHTEMAKWVEKLVGEELEAALIRKESGNAACGDAACRSYRQYGGPVTAPGEFIVIKVLSTLFMQRIDKLSTSEDDAGRSRRATRFVT